MINLPNGLFKFQEDCSIFLVDTVAKKDSRQTITVKAPTGAGKTVILVDFIDKYLDAVNKNTAFIWLCPGSGNLEEQSHRKMISLIPNMNTKTLNDVLLAGFEPRSTAFINWELITKKGNRAIMESEHKNLFDRIAEGHRDGLNYIIIVDEEHSNDTKKANDIINAFSAKNIIRVSATARENKLYEFYEINEADVISSGLITKALYINENVDYEGDFESEHGYLLETADKKRRQIAEAYSQQIGIIRNIRPLVIIQFPPSSEKLVKAVENKLEEMGYTYGNKMVAKWFSDEKKNIEKITEPSADPVFLLIKQAVATGWDCPRAKILVKLRDNMSEDFEIQTIGRLRRMPEAMHYDIEVLDFCYLYTFDEKYKESVKLSMGQTFERKPIFLKDKCKDFKLEKQYRNKDVGGLGERETFLHLHKFLTDKYKLTADKENNRLYLESNGYSFEEKIIGKMLEGKFVTIDSVFNDNSDHYKKTVRRVNTHKHGIELLHAVDSMKSIIGMTTVKTKVILERLFRKSVIVPNKLLSLPTAQYYSFIINNEEKLKSDFREAMALSGIQQALAFIPKTASFRIPEQENYRYDRAETDVYELTKNAYKGYSSAMLTEGIRSKSERLFEYYCEESSSVDWFYKNGDTGQQYFSIVYMGKFGKQWLFYPDYIIKKTNGDIWIIETKGGEFSGKSKNVDNQAENKFNALKKYAERHKVKLGFIRDKNDKLYINNSEYADDMSSELWKPLKEIF